mgnify:CR=1 FL=1
MRFHVLTLFPQMIEQGLSESITGRALKTEYYITQYGKISGILRTISTIRLMITHMVAGAGMLMAGRAGVSGCAQCGESDQINVIRSIR